ncbi:MAG: HAD-IA family hydrolase [Bacteroidales bacterium]|nr:HAD-IA family hydrolase [Bacteroidales bacterium]MBQ1755038.1 HAD-IA family hydrolase [Bacteroidales bacterium]MBQ1831131.1 HAD-IA family hydrolase [Bacteroidales bacterium]MBQ2148893.1 HAD-IA family hydrolase [Bacteroidales bacterium]MBQ2194754.1 HAD-IA family hydrolase [Bacteroidales bacterium]
MKKMILWDLDGTLIDTLDDLGEAVSHTLRLRGLPTHGREDYRRMVGHGVRNLVKRALEASGVQIEDTPDGDAFLDEALADFKAYYSAHIDVYSKPYPGIPELLAELDAAGVKLAVVSNKFQEGTDHLIREFFPKIRFVAILGNRPGYPLKPDPAIVEEAISLAGISRPEALLIGDSPTDMHTAENGGIDSLAVSWGYRTREDLAAYPIVNSVVDLRKTILEL